MASGAWRGFSIAIDQLPDSTAQQRSLRRQIDEIVSHTAQARLSLFSGAGSALPTPGSIIELVGLGAHFDGDVFVTAVHHDIAGGQWTTHVEFRRPPD